MRGAKSAKWVAGAAIIALAATACGGNDKDSDSGMNSGKADPNGILTAQLGEPQNPLRLRTPRRARAAVSCAPSSPAWSTTSPAPASSRTSTPSP